MIPYFSRKPSKSPPVIRERASPSPAFVQAMVLTKDVTLLDTETNLFLSSQLCSPPRISQGAGVLVSLPPTVRQSFKCSSGH